MQARVRFVRRPRNPLRRSRVSSARNAGESAISAEILCGDRACRARETQASTGLALVGPTLALRGIDVCESDQKWSWPRKKIGDPENAEKRMVVGLASCAQVGPLLGPCCPYVAPICSRGTSRPCNFSRRSIWGAGRVSHKSVPQECPATVSLKSVSQGCPLRVSDKSIPQECPIRVSHKSVPQECLTRVSYKSVLQECPTRVSHKSVLQECPTIVSYKSVPQECPTKMSHKSVPQQCRSRVSHKSGP